MRLFGSREARDFNMLQRPRPVARAHNIRRLFAGMIAAGMIAAVMIAAVMMKDQ
jgi:hypothetical protein